MLDKVFAYETIKRFDETMTEEVAVVSHDLRFDIGWGGAEFWSLAQHSFQRDGGKQLILAMFLVKDIVDRVARAAKLQLL